MRSRAFPRCGVLVLGLLAACSGDKPTSPDPEPDPVGALTVQVGGLPQGDLAQIQLSGPSSYAESIDATTTLSNLVPGIYSITASNANTAQGSYTPSPSFLQATVQSGQTAQVSIAYSPSSASSLDLSIGAMYLVQTVQRLDNTVPLIAGREALLRIFAIANSAAEASPQVRVTLYNSANQLLATHTLDAPGSTMATTVNQAVLGASWNVAIAPQHIVPGLKIVAELDPTNAIVESNEANNRRPAAGMSNVTVRSLPDIEVRFVPVLQSATGLTGNVNNGNADDFMALALKLYPTAGATIDVRNTYTTSAAALQANDANSAWGSVLSEMWALKQSEDASSSRHYYGVVGVNYGSGIAGLAYLSARVGLGRDISFPSLAVVFPHELGHNLSLPHAGCGVSGGDPGYPYPNGQIGVYGLDTELDQVKAPTLVDIMSYCPNVWISDYNYEQALDFREAHDKVESQFVGDTTQPCWLVWGSLYEGGIELQPIVEIDALPVLPLGGDAELRLEFGDGTSRSLRFAAVELAEGGRAGEKHFAWLLPRAELAGARALSSVRVLQGGHGAVQERVRGAASDAAKARLPKLTRVAAGLRVDWDAQQRPLLVLRDGQSGEILSFARGGRVLLPGDVSTLAIAASDGIATENWILSGQ